MPTGLSSTEAQLKSWQTPLFASAMGSYLLPTVDKPAGGLVLCPSGVPTPVRGDSRSPDRLAPGPRPGSAWWACSCPPHDASRRTRPASRRPRTPRGPLYRPPCPCRLAPTSGQVGWVIRVPAPRGSAPPCTRALLTIGYRRGTVVRYPRQRIRPGPHSCPLTHRSGSTTWLARTPSRASRPPPPTLTIPASRSLRPVMEPAGQPEIAAIHVVMR